MFLIINIFCIQYVYANNFVNIDYAEGTKVGEYSLYISYNEDSQTYSLNIAKGNTIEPIKIQNIEPFFALSDGKKLYYGKNSKKKIDIYLRDLKTNKDTNVGSINKKDSYDIIGSEGFIGKNLYFSRDEGEAEDTTPIYKLYRFNTENKAVTLVSDMGGEYLITSKSIFVSNYKNRILQTLHVMNLDGKNRKLISENLIFVKNINNKMYYVMKKPSSKNLDDDKYCLYSSNIDATGMKQLSKEFAITEVLELTNKEMIYVKYDSKNSKNIYYKMDMKTYKTTLIKDDKKYREQYEIEEM